ncbi:C40 family peptidase [Oceanobacillus sp. Castelsardo]|uniref:C40 family peptidase n=1 Tax=Oceanobacillus sp. Castelsardo TaxID=1851204 RepID=UPI0008380E3B|nr:NlpC/P60 family protein [Oceanobacillus sp. Castelsardo]
MAQSNQSVRKYVISIAFVTSLIFTPILSGKVFANAGAGASEGDISISESNLSNVHEQEAASLSEGTKIQQGDISTTVEDIQKELQEQGYYTYTIDGVFGPLTGQAVRDYQADHQLQVDGIVGPNTLETLVLQEMEFSGNNLTITEFSSSDSNIPSDIVAVAKSVIGTPYVWGGTATEGMDSSGFINYVFHQVGIDDVSRTHREMWENNGNYVDHPSIGDVVFFEGTYDTEGASHSGIYIGDNQMIHTGDDGVRVADISIAYWQEHYLGAKSFIE